MQGGVGISAVFSFIALLGVTIGAMPPHVTTQPSAARAPRAEFAAPRRVAVLAPVLTSYVAIDGGLSHVSALSEFTRRIQGGGIFGQIFPQLSTLPILGITGAIPDPELILHAGPDAVIAWRVQSEPLRKTGYAGLIELEGGADSAVKLWDILGRVSGQEARAADLRRSAEHRLPNAKNMSSAGEPTTVLPMSIRNDTLWIGRNDYFLNNLLERIGAENPARNVRFHGPPSPEEILLYDPDIIVMPGFNNEDNLKGIYGNPLWQTLRAVRNKRVYLMPVTSPFNEPVDQTLTLTWLTEIVRSSLPPTVRAAYRDAYSQAYHHDLTDEEIDTILYVDANSGSAGYEKFLRSPEGRQR